MHVLDLLFDVVDLFSSWASASWGTMIWGAF
jgi:hypothetical protein